jgi:hypothetical protein
VLFVPCYLLFCRGLRYAGTCPCSYACWDCAGVSTTAAADTQSYLYRDLSLLPCLLSCKSEMTRSSRRSRHRGRNRSERRELSLSVYYTEAGRFWGSWLSFCSVIELQPSFQLSLPDPTTTVAAAQAHTVLLPQLSQYMLLDPPPPPPPKSDPVHGNYL